MTRFLSGATLTSIVAIVRAYLESANQAAADAAAQESYRALLSVVSECVR